jgi:saccharopine dehydrogenase-like NADP-dependent oxidoreductase
MPLSLRPYRILVTGGYGHFGMRIARALAREDGVEVIIAGRHQDAGDAAVAQLRADSTVNAHAMVLDIDAPDLAAQLSAANVHLVIHTAGPFQQQGYAVAEAAIAAGADYIDLADGTTFVMGFTVLDGRARARGVTAVTGASTLPAVSSAVVSALLAEGEQPESIHIVIAPGQRTPRGVATMAAVLSYCGQPLHVRIGGRASRTHGWQRLRSGTYWQLGRRWSADCDVPDLQLWPQAFPGLRTVTFQAALELRVAHVALWMAAALVRIGIVRNWAPQAARLSRTSRWLDRFGTDEGGMQVRLAARGREGTLRKHCWDLVAHRGHGPEIPCIPAIILARRWAAGRRDAPGARSAMNAITLVEFDDAVRHLAIETRIERSTA